MPRSAPGACRDPVCERGHYRQRGARRPTPRDRRAGDEGHRDPECAVAGTVRPITASGSCIHGRWHPPPGLCRRPEPDLRAGRRACRDRPSRRHAPGPRPCAWTCTVAILPRSRCATGRLRWGSRIVSNSTVGSRSKPSRGDRRGGHRPRSDEEIRLHRFLALDQGIRVRGDGSNRRCVEVADGRADLGDDVVTYTPGDADDLAAAIARIVDEPEAREARLSRALTRVREGSWERESIRYVALVDRLARPPGRVGPA